MIGRTLSGTAYPFIVSHVVSAIASSLWSTTVSYGPTVCWFTTVTGVSMSSATSGRGGVAEDMETPVTVVNQQTVGPYETVVLHSDDAMALTTWLTMNGYAVPDSVRPIIDFYTQRRMDFLALK